MKSFAAATKDCGLTLMQAGSPVTSVGQAWKSSSIATNRSQYAWTTSESRKWRHQHAILHFLTNCCTEQFLCSVRWQTLWCNTTPSGQIQENIVYMSTSNDWSMNMNIDVSLEHTHLISQTILLKEIRLLFFGWFYYNKYKCFIVII